MQNAVKEKMLARDRQATGQGARHEKAWLLLLRMMIFQPWPCPSPDQRTHPNQEHSMLVNDEHGLGHLGICIFDDLSMENLLLDDRSNLTHGK